MPSILILSLMLVLRISYHFLFCCFFLWPLLVSSHTCTDKSSDKHWREHLCKFPVFILIYSLLSLCLSLSLSPLDPLHPPPTYKFLTLDSSHLGPAAAPPDNHPSNSVVLEPSGRPRILPLSLAAPSFVPLDGFSSSSLFPSKLLLSPLTHSPADFASHFRAKK